MNGKLALVTGASSGIGYHLALNLAERGYDLLVASAGDRLSLAAQEFRNEGVTVHEVHADLATRDGVEELARTMESLGPVEVACINAGVGIGGLFHDTDEAAEIKMIELNCVGTVQLAKHVVRSMKASSSGRILFTSSIAGEMVAPREAVYAATKAFVLSFAHSLRAELKEEGISVTALQPGPTDTDFFHRAGMDDTPVGQKGKEESEPSEVAKQGLDALFDGKDHVYSASFKTKFEGAVANFIPGSLKGAMHEKMAKPKS